MKTLWPLFIDGVQLPQDYSHFEAVYFLPFSSQTFLVLILTTSEGWKAEPTLEPLRGFFEHRITGLGIQHLNYQAIAPLPHCFKNSESKDKLLVLTRVLYVFRQYLIIYLLELTFSWWTPLSYRNQSIDLPSKSMDWFLYDNSFHHERVKTKVFCEVFATYFYKRESIGRQFLRNWHRMP